MNRPMEENRISRIRYTHVCTLDYGKADTAEQGKELIFNNWAWSIGYPMKKSEADLPTSYLSFM